MVAATDTAKHVRYLDLRTLPRVQNMQEWWDSLGGVPLERIRFDPWPGTATEADILHLDDHGIAICELYDGVLVEKTVGSKEAEIALTIGALLFNFVKPRKLGIVLGADGMLRLFGDSRDIRVPDVAFIGNDRLTDGKLPDERVAQLAPHLAVEVLSKSNTQREMDRKRDEYFRAGTKLVWYVDPPTKTVTVYTAADRSATLGEADTLDGGDALPGFRATVKDFFV